MSVKEALTAAKVSDAAIARLDEQGMLDAELLAAATSAELQQGCGINMGDAMRTKRAYPSATTAATTPVPTTPTAPIVAVIATPVTKSDEDVLKGVKNKDEADVEEARKRWGANTVFVTANDSSLDVPATLEALKFFKKHGVQTRFQNTEKKSVRTQSLDQLLKEEVELNPLTGKVLVPGDEMYELTEDQRLLIAFAVVTGVIPANSDEDGTIDGVKRKTGRWTRVETDFAQARTGETDHYSAAKKRLRRKAGEVAVGTTGTILPVAAAPALKFRMPHRIEGPKIAALRTALLAAFPKQDQFSQMMLEHLNVHLSHISGASSYNHVVFEVITTWAMSRGQLDNLVQAAYKSNPNCAELNAFVSGYLVA